MYDSYVSGLSVTHGGRNERKHIWTFAAGYSKANDIDAYNCPCANDRAPPAPAFVRNNYFCDSGNTGNLRYQWYTGHPLWDSNNCARGSRCCGPWFTTEVGANTEVRDDIEVRMCRYRPSNKIEDIGVDELEIYIS